MKHYVKNFLIFIPLIFVHKLFSKDFIIVLIGFIAFCFMASSIYIINDLKDIEEDKLNSSKKHRILASGKISKSTAIIISILCFTLSICICLLLKNYYALGFLILYFILNLLYSLWLKTVPIIDVFLIVSFYIIRIYYGGLLINVNVSSWLYLTTMSIAFYLALGKRRNELKFEKNNRNVLKSYNKAFLNKFMNLSLTASFIFYSLWSVEQNVKYITFTIPIVLLIMMKYSLNIESNIDADPTEVLFNDKLLIFACFIYGCVIIYIMR